MALYDKIGVGYDTTRRADPFIASRLLAGLGAVGDRLCLDVACGSGNYTITLADRGIRVLGIDQSIAMVRAAVAKQTSGGRPPRWAVGDAMALPFGAHTFAGAVCTLALHHFPAVAPVFREVRRVLADGSLVIFTATREQMKSYWLREYFPVAIERSADAMPSLDQTLRPLTEAGFSNVRVETYDVQPDLADFFLYSGKHRPEMYLEPAVRHNISTFASIAEPEEVAAGCLRLSDDIASGRIHDVMDAHRTSDGDYLFVVADG